MKLKEYQNDVLESLSRYLSRLSGKRQETEEYVEFQRNKGRDVKPSDYCRDTWDMLNDEKALPLSRDKSGNPVTLPYVPRYDGLTRPVPNICLKIPTGGGKTLLGCASVERIGAEYFKKQTGFVLWVVPSDAIYRQTWKAFANREHPYRQMLERASAGRVRLLERGDTFTSQDVDQQLCVMLLMLQAAGRKTKEQLRMFKNTGQFTSFFPDVDDVPANMKLFGQVPNLDAAGLETAKDLSVLQSLGNVLRIVRPIIIIDEGHKAYSEIALNTLCGFNPRFILELSATPNTGKDHVSNVLVDVTGSALKSEEMIKLPINLINESRADWKHTLSVAKEELDKLQKHTRKVRNNDGRYVRPILLIRVERTGKEQRQKAAIHSEDAREFLISKLGAQPEQIRVKSAELDELGDEDLLSEFCKVRYIITKDALREGWDCPFAYVLAILSNTTAPTALTQMIGRVLRQPEAKLTSVQELNECYVFTFDQEVQNAVDCVRRGLQEEGMGDLAASVRAARKGSTVGSRRETIGRRREYKQLKIFLPRVLSRHYRTREWRQFDYDRDLLSRLDWGGFSYTNRFDPDEKEAVERVIARVSVEDLGTVDDESSPKLKVIEEEIEDGLDAPALVRLLLDVVPNPWQGIRILNETLISLRKRSVSEERLYTNRLFLLKAMRDDLRKQVNDACEKEFRAMLENDELCFRLEVSNDPTLNWELAKTLELDVSDEDKILLKKTGEPLERNLFEKVYQKQFNGLEKDVAWYLDGEKAIRWWHRIAVHQDWHLQGWQRSRVYPDFLACMQEGSNGRLRFTILETKGIHLKGNDDTMYKEQLFDLLTEHSRQAINVGELKLGMKQHEMRFELLLENNWRERIAM